MANQINKKLFEIMNNKTVFYKGKTYKAGEGYIYKTDYRFFTMAFYENGETTPDSADYPLPDSNGKINLFNKSYSEFNTKGEHKTNMDNANALSTGQTGFILGAGIEMKGHLLDLRFLKALHKAGYKLVIEKAGQVRNRIPLLHIPEIFAVNTIIPEITITDTARTDGQAKPENLVSVKRQDPLKFDDSNIIALEENEKFQCYLEPEDDSARDDFPYPANADTTYAWRQYMSIYLYGLFTDTEKLR